MAVADGYCKQHRKQTQKQADQQRGTANERGYNYRWQVASKLFLKAHPLCAICQRKTPPRVTAATLVDHIKPHKGDPVLFWDQSNWQPACKPCHDEKTATEDGAFGNKANDEI
jgi:5-methylcytosine-specific restriction protein A